MLALVLMICTGGCGKPEAPDPAALLPDWRTYYNKGVGIEFRYPYTLSLEVDSAAGEGQLVVELQWLGRQTPVFKLETRPATALDAIRPGGRVEVMVGGLPGYQSVGEATGGGDEVQRISLVNRGRLYTFSGIGETFDRVLETVAFIAGSPLGTAGSEPGFRPSGIALPEDR